MLYVSGFRQERRPGKLQELAQAAAAAVRKPRISLRKAADRCWSRQETMVWFSCTLTLVLLDADRARDPQHLRVVLGKPYRHAASPGSFSGESR
jgi:hypothetical protein